MTEPEIERLIGQLTAQPCPHGKRDCLPCGVRVTVAAFEKADARLRGLVGLAATVVADLVQAFPERCEAASCEAPGTHTAVDDDGGAVHACDQHAAEVLGQGPGELPEFEDKHAAAIRRAILFLGGKLQP
jgi:hypothetical protein